MPHGTGLASPGGTVEPAATTTDKVEKARPAEEEKVLAAPKEDSPAAEAASPSTTKDGATTTDKVEKARPAATAAEEKAAVAAPKEGVQKGPSEGLAA